MVRGIVNDEDCDPYFRHVGILTLQDGPTESEWCGVDRIGTPRSDQWAKGTHEKIET